MVVARYRRSDVSEDVGNHITAEGLAALEREIEQLETEGRRAMAERIRTARAWGDLKENSEYHDAKDAQAHLETKIQRLRERRRNAVVVEAGAQGGRVALGTAVTVADGARETTYEIVAATEADPAARRLSIDSPLGRALTGHGVGDEVVFEAPRGQRRLRITEIR
jgi:transcription elongation factor GreA